MAVIHPPAKWEVNADAESLHAEGLAASVAGELDVARFSYARAEAHLDNLIQTPDVQMQSGRVLRDDGFTYVRELGQQVDPTPETVTQLTGSANARFNIVVNNIFDKLSDNTSRPKTARERDIRSERGATKSLIGRMAVARQIVVEDITESRPTPEQRKQLRTGQSAFGKREAHKDLRQGSNMYYLVSNAMHAARAERLNSSRKAEYAYVLPWLGRAAVGLLRADDKVATARNVVRQTVQVMKSGTIRTGLRSVAEAAQKTEFGTALVTAARIGVSLRSRKAAIASIRAMP